MTDGHDESISERQECLGAGPGRPPLEACEIGLGKPSTGGQFGVAHAAVAPGLLQALPHLPVHDVTPMLQLHSLRG